MCNFLSVLTLLKATYASPGLNLPFAGVISMTISGSVSPWHLCIVTAQASVNGNWLLVAWHDVFCGWEMLPVFYILVQHFGFYFFKHLCVLLLVQHVYYQRLLIWRSSFLFFHQLLHLLLYPLHHLLIHHLHQYLLLSLLLH